MKVLVFGSLGWIGSQFINVLKDHNIYYVETNIRADNERLVEDIIILHNPTHIVCCIGRKLTDNENYNENNYKNIRDNLYSPVILAILSTKYNIHLTYIGDGNIFNIFNNSNNINKTSEMIVKGFTDRLMRMYESNVLILRIKNPVVDFQDENNFITKLIKRNEIYTVPNSITVLCDMFPIIVDMIKNKTTGTFNLTNPDVITDNEILELYKRIFDNSFTWTNKIINNCSNNQMNIINLLKLYPNIPTIRSSIINCLYNMRYKHDCFIEL